MGQALARVLSDSELYDNLIKFFFVGRNCTKTYPALRATIRKAESLSRTITCRYLAPSPTIPRFRSDFSMPYLPLSYARDATPSAAFDFQATTNSSSPSRRVSEEHLPSISDRTSGPKGDVAN
jgi:hypothetical protein